MTAKKTQSFKPGYIYGSIAVSTSLPNAMGLPKAIIEKRNNISKQLWDGRNKDKLSAKGDGWKHWNNTLKRYFTILNAERFGETHVTLMNRSQNFERLLSSKAESALRAGKKLAVLDVGVGPGNQWLKHLKKIDFSGTSLTKTYHPQLNGLVKLCHAGELHKEFPAGKFDVITANFSLHHQEPEGIENIMHLLKPGGEAFIAMEKDEEAFYDLVYGETKGIFTIQDINSFDRFHYLHLKKN